LIEEQEKSSSELKEPEVKEGFKREVACVAWFLAVTIVIMILASH